MSSRKCRVCGSELPEKAKFCPGCGHEVERHLQYSDTMDSNIPEDAYYREIDDEEYAAIKKKAKEEERAKEEAEKQKAAAQKRAEEEAQRKKQEQERALEEERRRYEEERKRYETARRKAEQQSKRLYEGYRDPRKSKKEAAQSPESKSQSRKPNRENSGKDTGGNEKNGKKTSGMSVVVYLLIVLIGGFALYKTGIMGNLIPGLGGNSGKNVGTQASSQKKTDTTAETSKKETERTKEKESTKSTLADTDNSTMDASACLSPSDYNTVTSEDGSFSFGYPKYLFNHSEVNEEGTSYKLSYKDGSDEAKAQLVVYTEDNPGNALENAKQLYSEFASSVNKVYFKMQPTRIDSKGMARALIGGSVDSAESEGTYIIAANDGEKNYILQFTYPDPDMKNDYNDIDYVVDCVYRYCSFSGGTYQPRTHEQFLRDDMGTKK